MSHGNDMLVVCVGCANTSRSSKPSRYHGITQLSCLDSKLGLFLRVETQRPPSHLLKIKVFEGPKKGHKGFLGAV